MRVTAPLGTALLLVLAVLAPAPVSAAAPDPCAVPTIMGTDGDDHLLGTPGADVIEALGGDDVVEGLDGDDVICGGDGGDRLLGQGGNDQLYGEEQVTVLDPHGAVADWRPDLLDGGPGDDYLDGGGQDPGAPFGGDFVTFQTSPGGVSVDLATGTAQGDGDDTIVPARWNVVGSPFDDGISGDHQGNVLVGAEGDDILFGDYGADTLVDDLRDCTCGIGITVVGGGRDRMNGGFDDDSVRGGRGSDDLVGGIGADEVWGGQGSDTVDGDRGPDRVRGGRGDDEVQGYVGVDRVAGGAGADVVSGDGSSFRGHDDVVLGGPGPDTVVDYGTGWSRDRLRGNGGRDVIVNVISGRDEQAFGGSGHDELRPAPEDRRFSVVCRSVEVDRAGSCR